MKKIPFLPFSAVCWLAVAALAPVTAGAARKKHKPVVHKPKPVTAKAKAVKTKVAKPKPVAAKPAVRRSVAVPAAGAAAVPDRLDLYVRASRSITAADPPVDPVADPQPPQDVAARAERYSLARKEAWLQQNAAGFALFQQALRAQAPSLNSQKFDPAAADFSRPAALRQMARDKVIEAHARELRGDWNGAMQSRLDIWQLGNDVGYGGPVLDFLNGVAIQANGRSRVGGNGGNLTEPQLMAAIRRLEGLYADRMQFAPILGGEKQFGLKMWAAMLVHPEWRNPANFGEITALQRAELAVLTPTEVIRRYSEAMDRQRTLAWQPYTAPRPPFAQSQNTFEALLDPDWGRLRFTFARNDTYSATWLVSLALQAYKLERGTYPPSLNSLVPGFLRSIPVDPFSGVQPLRYARNADSYLLWSIGPDGVDDGGKPIDWPAAGKPALASTSQLPPVTPESKGDFVTGQNS